ncbi:MAG TPA: hypothetical protein VEX15_02390 [Nocardioidaceae bacterium]|nr:hypothetical protein [Nocardioidaceae bacterium]
MTAATLVLVGLAIFVAAAIAGPRRWATRARDEGGAAGDGFMKKVVKVSLIVMLVAGGIVWLVDRADDGPPNSGSGEHAPDKGKHR